MASVLTTKNLIVTLIITLLSAGTYVLNDKIGGATEFSPEQIASMISEDNWYYCELENTLKQCSSLTRYSVENAKCNLLTGTGDICTKSGERQAWNPFSDYVGLKVSNPYVESLQQEEIHYYNDKVNKYYLCNYNVLNDSWKKCFNDSIIKKNYSTFKPIGFNVVYADNKTYTITGDCCAFYNESPYKEFVGLPVISCRETLNNICNPLIQQTSNDETIYDEYGRIYVIHSSRVEPLKVGDYDYVNNYAVKISELRMN